MAAWTAALPSVLGALALGWYVVLWSVCLLGCVVAHRLFREPWPRSPLSSDEHHEAADAPGVTILRPLAGLDCNLYTNLCSTFEQQYPTSRFEIILSVRSPDDQALPVARQVAARYPHVDHTVLVGDVEAGVNPKINNLVRGYAAAKYDVVWVVDSQVSLGRGALARAVDALTQPTPRPSPLWLRRAPHSARVGLVHHVPLGVLPADTWASHVERVFLSATHAKMYLAINALAVDSCVMGKSNMYRKSDLARVPDSFFHYADEQEDEASLGADASFDRAERLPPAARPLARFGIYLAEDNMLALSLWRAPLTLAHRVAPGDVAEVAVGDIQTLQEYARRRMRWIRVRRHMVPAATYVEPFTESLVAGLCGWYGYVTWVRPWLGGVGAPSLLGLAVFYALHLGAWHLSDRHVLTSLRHGEPLPASEQSYFFGAWCLRELLALPIWAWAMAGSTVQWRGQRYRILQDARAASMHRGGAPPVMTVV